MSAGRNAEVADALIAHGYDLRGFSPAQDYAHEGRKFLVSSSPLQDLCCLVGARSFVVLPIWAARSQYPGIPVPA